MERHKCKLGIGCANSKSSLARGFAFVVSSLCIADSCYLLPLSHALSLKFICFTDNQVGIYLPCYDIFRNIMEDFTTRNAPTLTPYVPLVAGSVARSLACVSCYPIELARTRMQVSCVV